MAKKRAARARTQATARKRRNRLMLNTAAAAIIAVVALIVVASVLRDDGGKTIVEHPSQRQGRILGSESAPVILTVWEDFQCPACKVAHETIITRIEQDYVITGKVQLHFRHFAFLGQESVWAAEAAECAAEQNKFWEYASELFKRQRAESSGVYRKDRLKEMAASVGLDIAAFNTCLDTDRFKSVIEAEKKEGERLGVAGTPTFFVDGKPLTVPGTNRPADWREYATFSAILDDALKVGR